MKRGFRVINETLPCHNGMIPPNTQAENDIYRVRSIIVSNLEAGEDVIVAMHSIGGCVGTLATAGLSADKIPSVAPNAKGRIISLVHIAGFVNKFEGPCEDPHHGIFPKFLTIHPEDNVARIVPELASEFYYNDMNAEQVEKALAKVRPFPTDRLVSFASGTSPQVPLYKTVTTTYIIPEDDRIITVPELEAMLARAQEEAGVEFREVRMHGGHSIMISAPSAVANAIESSYGV